MTENRWARKPKPASREMFVDSYYFAYDSNGVFMGEVRLTADSRRRYERRGYTFKRRK